MQEAMEKQARGRRKTADQPGNPRSPRVFLGPRPTPPLPGFDCMVARPHHVLGQASDTLSRGTELGNVQWDLPRKGADGRLVQPASGCGLHRGSHGNVETPVVVCRQPAGRVQQGRDNRFQGRKTPV